MTNKKFRPTRLVRTDLTSGAIVTVVTDGHGFGLELVNAEGERTRARISPEAMAAISAGFHALSAGGGETIEYGWVHIKSDTLVPETPNAD